MKRNSLINQLMDVKMRKLSLFNTIILIVVLMAAQALASDNI